MRAAIFVSLLALGAVVACPSTTGSSTSDAGTPGSSSSSSSSGASGSSSSSGGPRQCAGMQCHFNEVCVLNTDGGMCALFCDADGGCGAGMVCRTLVADAGVAACLPGGGVGDPCGGAVGCLSGLLCASAADAGASCREPCNVVLDGGEAVLECPANYVCFPAVDDGGVGACFPR